MEEDSRYLTDELDDLIYISDPHTYELIYLNRMGKQKLNLTDDCIGQKCYKVLQGLDSPCKFCNNSELSFDHFLTWEHTNNHFDRHYMLKDKLIQWNGKPLRMEIAIDITDKESISQSLSEKLDMEQTISGCIGSLLTVESLDESVNLVLKAIGSFYRADRAYIFQMNDDNLTCNNTYEWCRDGVSPQIEKLQNVPLADRWMDSFLKGDSIILDDIETIRETSPEEYEILNMQDIRTLYATPMLVKNFPMFYIGIDNPSRHLHNLSLLESLIYFITNEITKRQLQSKLEYMGYHDALTGLLTRNSYLRYLQGAVSRNFSSMGVIVADINGLKQINQTYGHELGNNIVKETADVLLRFFPEETVFRLSGDEFLVICENISREHFINILSSLKKELNGCNVNGVTEGHTWADQDIDIQALVNHADELMFIEKQNYYKNINAASKHHSPILLEQLLSTIKEGRFSMYLQPKVRVKDESLIGAEALVRYQDPNLGVVLPGKFIPILEHDKTIKYVDFFIYEEVLKTLARWRREGYRLFPISLNFSRITMLETDLIDTIACLHQKYDIPKDLVEIEITETIGEMERETIAEIGSGIKQQGFTIALDDFGAKYTSMSILTVMNFDELKLDRSLISNISKNRVNHTVVKYVIEMCREMNVTSLAEGVEDPDQLKLLRELSCDVAQGFLFGKPMPCDEFEKKYEAELAAAPR